MLLLTGTAHLIRLTCGTAGADVRVNASWIDTDAGAHTLGSQNTPSITTTTTTTVVPSPTGTVKRNVKHLNVENNHATQSTRVTVEHYDGTTACPLMGVTLLPGENLVFGANGRWRHHESAQGAEYVYTLPAPGNLGLTGTLAETMPRDQCTETNCTIPSLSGTLYMQAIYLYAGQVINNLIFHSSTTAAITPTNNIAGIYNKSRVLLAQTANQLTAAWAANTVKTLALTAVYRVPKTDLYYIGFFMTAATIIKMKGGPNRVGGHLSYQPLKLCGDSTAGLTTVLPDPAAAIATLGVNVLYAAVS